MEEIEEISDMYKAGELDYLILGAIRVTLENLGYSRKDITNVLRECQNNTFDMYDAETLILLNNGARD